MKKFTFGKKSRENEADTDTLGKRKEKKVKKDKPEKRTLPPTVLRKRLMKGTFWTVFSLTFAFSGIAAVRSGNSSTVSTAAVEESKGVQNLAVGAGAETFVLNFAKEYFTWENTDEGKKKRVERLKPYIAAGLDQQAGLQFEGVEWNSSHTTNIQTLGVEETGENTANIKVRVKYQIKKQIPAAAEGEEPTEEKKDNEKYFVVPIKTENTAFAVYQLPYIAPPPVKSNIAIETESQEKSAQKVNDPRLSEEMKSFLQTFLKVYTTGSQKELSYYTKDEDIQSLQNVMVFSEIKTLEVYKTDKQDLYEVGLEVIFTDGESKLKMTNKMELELVLGEANRWFVQSIKNK
jgi:hypothetical protein